MKEIDKRIQEVKEQHTKLSKEIEELEALALKEKEEKWVVGDWVKLIYEPNYYFSAPCIVKVLRENGETSFWADTVDYDLVLDRWKGTKEFCITKASIERKATNEEIESFLIKEAEKKGFVKGAKVVIESSNGGYSNGWGTARVGVKFTIDTFKNLPEGLFVSEGSEHGCLLSQCKLLPSVPQISIGGKPVEFNENGAIIIDKFFRIEEINEQIESFRILHNTGVKVKGLLIQKCSGDEVLITPQQLETISKHFAGRNKI